MALGSGFCDGPVTSAEFTFLKFRVLRTIDRSREERVVGCDAAKARRSLIRTPQQTSNVTFLTLYQFSFFDSLHSTFFYVTLFILLVNSSYIFFFTSIQYTFIRTSTVYSSFFIVLKFDTFYK
jgi:hypothetical protein